jgi:tetratricopeptide (TPR) repeat protein
MIFVALGLIFLYHCAPQPKMRYSSAGPARDLENKMAAADAFFKKGCYVGFKKAIQVYEELYSQPSIKNKIIVPFVKTLILMAVRERELGILNDGYVQKASNIIRGNPALQYFVPYIELVNWMYPKTKGIMRDIDTVGTWQIANKFLKNDRLNAEMRFRAGSDDYFAYLYVTFSMEYAQFLNQKEELSAFANRYPDSILFKYRNATIFPRQNRELLEGLLKADPEFYEAYYHLGELALGTEGPLEVEEKSSDPFEADKEFLKAYEGIPESPQNTIYLGGIYFLTEEYDKGVEYFDKTLAIAPTYRDALLGKSICLSYMGKNKEAIEILNRLVSLGSYLMGESHYWLAWNYHELKDTEKAQLNIEESKTRLPTDSEVFGLAGTIALEKGELGKAEREFEASLEFNGKNIKSILGLGQVFALKHEWLDSASFFSHAAKAAAQEEIVLDDKIRAIESSTLALERKAGIIGRKKQQRGILEETEAMACYEAAVGFLNAGRKEQALNLARKAVAHPQFREAAEQLIKHIK